MRKERGGARFIDFFAKASQCRSRILNQLECKLFVTTLARAWASWNHRLVPTVWRPWLPNVSVIGRQPPGSAMNTPAS